MSVFGVFGEFDSDNIGDILIGEGAFIVLSEQLSDVRKIPLGRISSSNKSSIKIDKKQSIFKRFHRHSYSKSIYYRHILELSKLPSELKALDKYTKDATADLDVIIIGGGQLLHDNTLRMLVRVLMLITEANKKDKPIVFFGTGASTPRTIFSQLLFKKIFREAKNSIIFLRDKRSITIVTKFLSDAASDNVFLIPDTAIAKASQYSLNIKSNNQVWGLAPISQANLPFEFKKETINQDEWWIYLAELLIQKGIKPVLFCSGVKSDHDRCLAIQSKFETKNNVRLEVLSQPKETDTFLKQLAGFDRVIAQRLHISISYFSMGGTPYSLPWDQKVSEFYNMIGIPERHSGCQDISEVIANVLKGPESSVTVEYLYSKLMSCVDYIKKSSTDERCY